MSHGDQTPEGWLRLWVQVLSGCRFAGQLATRGGAVVSHAIWGAPHASRLSFLLEQEGEAKNAVIFTFPERRTPQDVADLLSGLSEDDRWESRELLAPTPLVAPGRLLQLTWRTAYDRTMTVLGLGPFGTMPVTRRAPYVGLAVWPGHEENDWYFGRPGAPARGSRKTIGLPDMPTKAKSQQEHDDLWDDTQRTVTVLAPEWEPLRTALRHVSFCLDLPESPALSKPPQSLKISVAG